MWDETITICQQAIDLLQTDIFFYVEAYEHKN